MWEKDGKQYDGFINGRLVTNPTVEMLIEAGYTWVEPIVTPTTNEQIKYLRQQQYEERSDHLFIAYQKYLALGETDKAEIAKQEWLTEVNNIDNEYPYIEEE